MSDRFDERLLRYLEGRSTAEERADVERELAASPALEMELEEARRGLEAMRTLAGAPEADVPPIAAGTWTRITGEEAAPGRRGRGGALLRRAAAIAALLLLPASGWFARGLVAPPLAPLPGPGPDIVGPTATIPNPQLRPYILFFEGAWPDGDDIEPQERMARNEAYMSWVEELESEDALESGYELGASPGIQFTRGPLGGVTESVPDVPPAERIVGVVVIRAGSEEEARRIAAGSPHVRYGAGVLLKAAGGG